MSLTNNLFRAARLSATLRAARRGRLGQRVTNIAIGRLLGRAGVWSKLWRR